jgi:hypothetical protein
MGLFKFAAVIALVVSLGVEAWPAVTQTSEVHGVIVAVTPGKLEPDSDIWDFAISFEAGSLSLDDDVMEQVVLVAEGLRVKPLAWEGQATGVKGHRAGVLKFIALHPRPREMQLEMTRPGEAAPRVFTFVFGEWSA